MKKLLLVVLLLPLLVFSCTNDENQTTESRHPQRDLIPQKYDTLKNVVTPPMVDEPPYEVSLIKEVEYGDTEDVFLSNYLSIGGLSINVSSLRFAVDDNGQVFIANNHQIEAFDAKGNYLKTLGREGRGPGEFNNHSPLVPKITANWVYAFDEGLSRVNVYQADSLLFSHSFILDIRKIVSSLDATDSFIPSLDNNDVYIVNDTLMLLGFEEPYQESIHGGFKRYIMLDRNGDMVSKRTLYYKKHANNSIVNFAIGTGGKIPYMPMPMPNESYMKISFDRDYNIYAVRGKDFLIKEYTRDGTYKRAIYYPYEHSKLDKEDRQAIIEYHATNGKREENYNYPDYWPTIHDFFVDDEGRLWVATITDDEENYEWWILKNNGQLLAKFKRSGERLKRNHRGKGASQTIVKNGYFYISETNEESGANIVAKYKIVFQKN